MCGLAGIAGTSAVNQLLYDALTVLQHRGQDAAGIVTTEEARFNLRKNNGLVRDVFHTRHMLRLHGHSGIGHVRYPTAGSASSSEAQPFYVNSPYGIALAHNGNLTNADALKRELFATDRRHINTESDSEVLLNVFAQELLKLGRLHVTPEDVFDAVAALHRRCRGAYAVVALVMGAGILGLRDPLGIRPLVIGRREGAGGVEHMLASESVALAALGFETLRDVHPGEAVLLDFEGRLHSRQCAAESRLMPCIFEYVYLARPDSIMDGVSVHEARRRMGDKLAAKLLRLKPDHGIEAVIPIPDTSRTAALQLANRLHLPYTEGFIKNRYIGRTFIMPGSKERKRSVRQKLNPIDSEFRDKVVLLVDDSIVRGTTSQQIIQMAREAGARKVYFASAAPPVRYPNVYGIDMPTTTELIAAGRTEEQVRTAIGADWLLYQDVDDLFAAVREVNPAFDGFEASVFTGEYITGDVTPEYLNALAAARNDSAKEERRKQGGGQLSLPNVK